MIQLEPNNDSNFYKRYRLYLRQHKYKEALSDLSSALNLKPKSENTLAQRGKLYMKLGKCSDAYVDFQSLRRYRRSCEVLAKFHCLCCYMAVTKRILL